MQVTKYDWNLTDIHVCQHMQLFSDIKADDKILMNTSTGILIKDDRMLQSWRRAAWGAFDAECVEYNFDRAVSIITEAGKSNETISKESTTFKIYELYLKAITGVKTLALTYEREKKFLITSRLNEIAKKYLDQFKDLPVFQTGRKKIHPRKAKSHVQSDRPQKEKEVYDSAIKKTERLTLSPEDADTVKSSSEIEETQSHMDSSESISEISEDFYSKIEMPTSSPLLTSIMETPSEQESAEAPKEIGQEDLTIPHAPEREENILLPELQQETSTATTTTITATTTATTTTTTTTATIPWALKSPINTEYELKDVVGNTNEIKPCDNFILPRVQEVRNRFKEEENISVEELPASSLELPPEKQPVGNLMIDNLKKCCQIV